jgi:hypothetical protein
MDEVYGLLNVTKFAAKTRLRAYIMRLQEPGRKRIFDVVNENYESVVTLTEWQFASRPSDIPAMEVTTTPAFVSPHNWMDNVITKVRVEDQYQRVCRSELHVSPLALVRCSRGGKTRSLHELGARLKVKFPDAVILYVSFNDYTSLTADEKRNCNPLQALCLRIAFAARQVRSSENPSSDFIEFAKTFKVHSETVIQWLKGSNCILLVDELNLIGSNLSTDFSTFIKNNFLIDKGRMFVFSSHVVGINNTLTRFMESHGNRNVIVERLPTGRSLNQLRTVFKCPDLLATEALYFGLIPALLFESKMNRYPHQRRSDAIKTFISSGISLGKVYNLLSSLF